MTLEPNTTISHYKILSSIGKGGMGEVYLAQDTELDRKAAIKFLSEELSTDSEKVNRFIQEAKAASALNHPNILTVYEIGSWEETRYIATEYIEGETLRDIIRRKESIHLNRILKIAIQVAEALSAAHEAGIAHRDIKPENIMVRRDGYVKVLDFGLAKLVETKKKEGDISLEGETKALVKTSPGVVMGTVTYMSPEQAQGKETDARTDIWSLGVVLYEMLSGKAPFGGKTTNHTIVAILETEPKLLENIPDELQRIVRKTLAKEKESRYQTARDLLIDLKNLRRDLDIQGELERSIVPNKETELAAGQTASVPGSSGETATASGAMSTQNLTSTSSLEYAVIQAKSHKFATGVIALVLIGVISAVSYFAFFSGKSDQIESVAVMPFVNESGDKDLEYLSDGMTETLIGSLSRLPGVNVKSRSSVFRYKGKSTPAKQIGEELGVRAILNGRIVKAGERMTLSLELIEAATDNVLWSEKYERGLSEIVSLQKEIGRDVSTKLKSKLTGDDEAKLAKDYSNNPKAFELYLKGRFYWNRRSLDSIKTSLEYFKQAVEADPNYALAYTGLSDAYSLIAVYNGAPATEMMPKAREAAQKALSIEDNLAEAHTALGLVLATYDFDVEAGEREYKRAIELDPNYGTAHQWYGELLYFLGRFNEAQEQIDLALKTDPRSNVFNRVKGIMYLFQKRYKEAEEQQKKTIAMDPSLPGSYADLSEIYFLTGRDKEAVDYAVKNMQRREELGLPDAPDRIRKAFAENGRAGALQEIIDIDKVTTKNNYAIAKHYLLLGEKDKAFEWLDKAFAEKTFQILQIKVDPGLDTVRDDPRYKELVRKLGLRNED